MSNAVKGALLSGIIFPGIGQLWLKRYARGWTLILAVSASLAIIVTSAAQQALGMLEKAEAEGGAVDLAVILNAASGASATPGDPKTTVALAVLTICWVAGIVDAYLAGKKVDRHHLPGEKGGVNP